MTSEVVLLCILRTQGPGSPDGYEIVYRLEQKHGEDYDVAEPLVS